MDKITDSKRYLYTASEFAKKNLIYLEEVGETKALLKHTSARNKLNNYLLFIVLDGDGSLTINKNTYKLSKNSISFINCNESYSHTSNNWTIKWIHFNGNNMNDIYNKFLERFNQNTFKTKDLNKYINLLDDINNIVSSNEYIKDFKIYEKIVSLLTILMNETIYDNNNKNTIYNIEDIKNYLDNNYLKNISLNQLSNKFYINKYYLTRLFKETYGITINNYINNLKITKAKELLRFTKLSIDNISKECGIKDNNYFSRLFKSIEGITPNKFRKLW